jgi:transposase
VCSESVPKSCRPQNPSSRRQFVYPNRDEIFFGARRLRDYLEQCGRKDVLRLSDALDKLSWTDFEKKYDGPGRPPYAPRLMVGLIMYGLLKGVNSLRGLESMSQIDMGCMWICAGIQPDHSNIGRFVLRHQEEFEGPFFEMVTRLALKETKSGVGDVAGDGTVIQAAASRYRTVKREALDRKLKEAREASKGDPDDPGKTASREKYESADSALSSREAKRKAKGKPIDRLRVSTTEPEATYQPLKNKSFAPSYKPSVLANDARVIVGKDVDPDDESSVVAGMLDEAERISESKVNSLLLDGNYCNETILNEAANRDLKLLCSEQSVTPKKGEKIRKVDFVYDKDRDVYICPAGHILTARSRAKDGSYVQYERHGCTDCELRPRCFSPKSTRRVVRRLAIDESKEELRELMKSEEAQKAYAQRKAMVEPVFSFMSVVMGLRRFRRRGLQKARLEFSLHASAYNLGRILAALEEQGNRFIQLAMSYLGVLWALLLFLTRFWRLPRRIESRKPWSIDWSWTPAFAGVTEHDHFYDSLERGNPL